ncbi:metabolite traffic protein EboE [Streptomyces marianii]|uniref:TIM barrel protein n=1 Tax=Streptomyces marianii TaxID=1817406 RepID=A0A5R9E1R2_9ACTN|nr:metabolite traffic protein EboE [Streptomyces marianii]TLQ41943.1 TIM barrel protein [Streptomyces marianii]
MRFRHPGGSTVHLSYGTNVHPAEDLAGITTQLGQYAVPVRERLGTNRLGVGLWLPADAAAGLAADPAATARLRAGLRARGLETVTLNGFPYRSFHAPVVKRAVYTPDWSEPARLAYTLSLARILAALLPDDVEGGSVSTLPWAWREPWLVEHRDRARRHLDSLASGLKDIRAETGRMIRVGLEPEPGCVAETVSQAVDGLIGTDSAHVGLCLDACHLAVAHEDPATAVAHLQSSGIPVVKLQASAALQADDPSHPAVRSALRPFAEPRFLHQTREAVPGGGLLAADDLGEALDGPAPLPGRAPWRVHYHVPLHARPEPPLTSTRPVLMQTLGALFGGERAITSHVEVETYTWSVLPEGQRPNTENGLSAGIAAELDWARDRLGDLGLKEHTS